MVNPALITYIFPQFIFLIRSVVLSGMGDELLVLQIYLLLSLNVKKKRPQALPKIWRVFAQEQCKQT